MYLVPESPTSTKEIRHNHYRAIHAMARDLGLTDEEYRGRLYNLTGESSCKDMTIAQLEIVSKAFDDELNPPTEPTQLDNLVEAYRLVQDSVAALAKLTDTGNEAVEMAYQAALANSNAVAHEIARLVSEGAR